MTNKLKSSPVLGKVVVSVGNTNGVTGFAVATGGVVVIGGVMIGVGVGVGGVTTGVGGVTIGAVQVCFDTESASRVTAPFLDKTLPFTTTPEVTVIDVKANILPEKFELVPSVADEPTTQKILHACAPLVSNTLLAEAVVRAELI